MGLFNRKTDSSQPENFLSEEFQRLSIREVLVFTSWGEGNIFLHFEKGGKNFVKARVNESWYELVVDSRSSGTALMNEIRADWKNAHKAGLLPENVSFYSYGVKIFGFAPVDFNQAPDRYPLDFLFSLGRELDEKFQSGWYPHTEEEKKLLINFLVFAPARVGFFGPYKFILKAMTDNFSTHVSSMESEFASHIAASIGMGYGRLEGYISRERRSPVIEQDWHIDELRHLPELNGFRYPRLKTIQYMMRKGWRFLDYLEKEAEPLVATRFKTHVLRGADLAHQVSDLEEERFLQYQQLTTRIIFRDSGLATRDRESRKVELGPRKERHNLQVSKKFVSELSSAEKTAYKNWIAGLTGKNIAVTLYALELSRAVPEIQFNWTQDVVKTLINSDSEFAKKSVYEAINEDPSLLQSIAPALVSEYLDKVDEKYLDKILAEFKAHSWTHQGTIQHWVGKHLEKKLSERELKIAIFFMLNTPGSIGNNIWSEGLPKLHTLFLQIAEQTKLQPIELWANFSSLDIYNEAQIYGFYGVAPHDKYPRGLFDVIDIRSKELLELSARPLARFLAWNRGAQFTNNFLSTFFNSPKRGATDLVWYLLGGNSLNAEIKEAFIEHLNSIDPSGSAYLRAIESSISLDDKKSVLRFLITLSDESKETFWRRNKVEIETLLMSWKGFPAFFWTHLDSIPQKTVEKIRKFEGLNAKVLKQISPSSIARMTASQVDYFVFIVNENPSVCSNVSLLRAMLIAPSASINEMAAKYVKNENKYAAHWLLMLESNLPITQQAALRYLETQVDAKDFASKLLMALDSNNIGARRMALSLLSKIKSTAVLTQIVDALVENRNTDTWKIVSKNLELISDVDKYKEFTNQVFLSRRKGRSVKEEIKFDIEELIEDISEAVEKDTLIRMAHSSVAADRDWALKQIALNAVEFEDVTVEAAWKGDFNV